MINLVTKKFTISVVIDLIDLINRLNRPVEKKDPLESTAQAIT